MPTPRVCVLRAPGTNCDVETAFAFEHCGGVAERQHLFRLLEAPEQLKSYQILCIPGGFSYGDDIGAGVIFASRLRNDLGEALRDFLTADKLVLGICNGFQVLLKAGVLPGGAETWQPGTTREAPATLTWNDNGKYTARWVTLETAGSPSAFLRGIDRLDLPVAHGEGKLVPRTPDVLKEWRTRKQVALRYVSANGAEALPDSDLLQPFPINPNGSTANIAGLCDPTGRVLGLMPHPERFLFGTQHPHWTRKKLPDEGAGMQVFRNAVDYFA